MKQNLKRFLSLALMLILVFSLAVPALADDGAITCNEGTYYETFIMTAKKNGTISVPLAYSYDKPFTINFKEVTVKGTAGAKLVELRKNDRRSGNASEYCWGDPPTWESYEGVSDSTNYSAVLMAKKTGTAIITYKVNGVAHTLTVNIKSWVNPIKSIKMTGVKGGKNLVKKSANTADFRLNSDVKKATLKIVPASGWDINYLRVFDSTTGTYQEISNMFMGMKSASLNWGKLERSHSYSIYASFYNEKLSVSEQIYYYINPVA